MLMVLAPAKKQEPKATKPVANRSKAASNPPEPAPAPAPESQPAAAEPALGENGASPTS
jgi:hypothetical protein